MKTAEPIATGPFHGFFPEGATLYRLDPPCVAGGHTRRYGIVSKEIDHVIVTALDVDECGHGPATTVFAADGEGQVDVDFFRKFGAVVDIAGNDAEGALARLGY